MELDQELWSWFQTYGLPPSADQVEDRCNFRHENGERCRLVDGHDPETAHVIG